VRSLLTHVEVNGVKQIIGKGILVLQWLDTMAICTRPKARVALRRHHSSF